ncbi:DNA-binding transcriptional regulator, AcrR family [Thermostaphylospora chromogena]|uniref:DNA-binding transcriptional regulator, AcrR family n=1 Tax=Thermostaphylospora chromogena TaxID=35622 RepID=A0A1H1DE80_9ACTN|nr:DNA-binding transcriptional regulator, AcrR family [Thermostaphylospora chromogena]
MYVVSTVIVEDHFESGEPTPLRRRPAQRRSARRVERMLDACAELLDESGYEALTTTRIAERAGVAIGSVYQFFPDKRAIAQALARRNVELLAARVGRRFIHEDYRSWWDAVDAIIDEYVDMHRSVPGFRFLHFDEVVQLLGLQTVADSSTVIAGRMRALLLEEFGVADSEEVERGLMVVAEAGDAVLKLAFRHDPQGAPEIVAEAKRLIRGYLAGLLTPAREPEPAQPEG